MPTIAIPNTGSAIQMGKVRNAYGLTGTARLRADLGAQISITSGAIRLSADFGGRMGTADYA